MKALKSVIPTSLLNLRHIFGAPLAYRPGDFYSPICDRRDLERHYRDPDNSDLPEAIYGIDLNLDGQRELWRAWTEYLREFPFPATKSSGFRYFHQNRQFGIGDATVLYCMLRHFRPRRHIEVGSGFSSACTLDTIERYLDGDVQCTFIEPFPERLHSLLGPRDSKEHAIMASPVQDVPLSTFDQLQAGDILFLDTTHIVKTGSDVAFELFEVLPRLKSGVIVHLHDMFYPFEYPKEWVIDDNRSWNEIYALRAFLMNNSEARIIFFNDFFGRVAGDLVERDAPWMSKSLGGGLWLRWK